MNLTSQYPFPQLRQKTLSVAVVMMLGLVAACGPKVDLPPFTQIETGELLDDVAAQIDASYAAAQKSPKSAEAAAQYGMVLATYGRDEAADIALQRARLLEPKDAKWTFIHGFIQRRLGKTQEALTTVETGLALAPDQIDLLVKRAELLFDLARFDEARPELEKALSENPTYPLAQYYQGRIHLQQKDWSKAVERFEKMLSDGIKVNEVHYNLSTAYRMAGQSDKAAAQLELSQSANNIKIAGFDPALMQINKYNVGDQPHILRAAEYYRAGNVDKAIEELVIAHKKNPKSIGSHTNLVRMYGHNKQLDKAVYHYNEAKAIDPDFAQLETNIAFAYQTAGEFDKAAEAYGRAAEQNPSDPAIQAELGFALGKSGQLDQGIVHLQNSLELQPVNRDLRFILGEALVRQRNFPEAIKMFRSALTPEDQKTIAVLRSLARTHVLSSNKDAALESLDSAVELAEKYDNDMLVEALKADIEKVKFATSRN